MTPASLSQTCITSLNEILVSKAMPSFGSVLRRPARLLQEARPPNAKKFVSIGAPSMHGHLQISVHRTRIRRSRTHVRHAGHAGGRDVRTAPQSAVSRAVESLDTSALAVLGLFGPSIDRSRLKRHDRRRVCLQPTTSDTCIVRYPPDLDSVP